MATCTHAFDCVNNIELPNPDAMYDTIVSSRVLPDAIGFKKALQAHTVHYLFTRNIDGTFSVFKHIHFQKRALITLVQEAIHGQGFGVDVDKFPIRKSLPLILQHMIMSLGGVCVVRRVLATVHTDKKLLTDAQIDAGFDFIEDNASMKSSSNAHIRWIMKQKNNPELPLFEWPENKIKEAVHNLQNGTSLARLSTTIRSHFLTEELGANKSAPSMPQNGHAQILIFAGEPGSIFVPIIYDDGDISGEVIASLKAFFDVAAEDVRVQHIS